MEKVREVVRKILIWHYERGTLQYDIICGLILAFIFFVPRGCFVNRDSAGHQQQLQTTATTPGNTAPTAPGR